MHLPGIANWDDDFDTHTDEDCWGNLPGDQEESDVYYGAYDSVDSLMIVDNSANWRINELVGRKVCLAIPPLYESMASEIITANTEKSITTANPLWLGSVPGGWAGVALSMKVAHYKVGNAVDDDGDGRADDVGYIGCPDDDDENGYEDDFRGWDFVHIGQMWFEGCDNEDYTNEDNNPTGLLDHGTSVASQIASAQSTGRMMGVAPKVKILPLRIGWTTRCAEIDADPWSSTAALRAFQYAIDAHVDVISISLDANFGFDNNLVQAAIDSGIIVVRAAGNDTHTPNWMDNSPQDVVWVGGLNPNDGRWEGGSLGESNFGPWVDISARAQGLAVAVWGVDRREVPGHPELPWEPWMPANEWHGYAYAPLDGTHAGGAQSGTSLAAPAVAGVMALVKSRYPHWTAQEVIDKVLGSTDNIYGPGMVEDRLVTPMGSGRVNAYKALTFYGNVAALGNATWTNELWIGGDILVPSGRSLTLVPGTTVNVAIDDLLSTGNDSTGIEFVVNGELHIQGTPGSPVTFRLFEEGGAATEYVVNTTVSASTFTMASLPAQCAAAARYPIASGSTDTTTVFAVEVMAGAAVDSVKVDLSDLGASGLATLRDDGEGEDSAAGDGIYTSGRFQANVSVGTRNVDVVSWVDGGPEAHQDVVLEAVANKAKFIDVSASTGDLYSYAPTDTTATPYASVYFNTAPSDSVGAPSALLVTIDDRITAPMFMRLDGAGPDGAPQFTRMNPQWLGNDLPAGSRGICFADFDNDGDNDFFVCGVDSAVLYENRLADTEGMFVNVTGAAFGLDKADLAGSVAASWGDYNLDGFVDLFVATTDYDGAVRDLVDPGMQQYATVVFRNKGGATFDKTDFGSSATGNVCLSGCWVDLDHDGDLELVTVQMDGEYPTVLENSGFAYQSGDALLVGSIWDTTGDAFGANSVSVTDYDHDRYPDLLVTEVSGSGRAVILQNNYDGTAGSKSFTPIELSTEGAWSGASVADFDLNGQEDYLLLPRSGEAALFMAQSYGTAPEFRDLGYTLGLRAGVTSGAIAGDFNHDHDPDLYLGRLKTSQFQYKNVRQNAAGGDDPDSQQKWLEVSLGTTGSSNGGLIGTVVSVEASGQHWMQVVDGGSGCGGQRPGRLLFGLGDIAAEEADLRIEFPSRAVIDTTVSVNETYLGIENEPVALKAGTRQDPEPDFEFDLQPGSINWIFKWRTTNVKGDVRRDVVHVENFMGYPLEAGCSIGISPYGIKDLEWGDPGVSHLVYWDGTFWQHEVRWWGLPCNTWCQHRFTVTSSSGNGNSADSGLRVTTPTSLCLPDGIEE